MIQKFIRQYNPSPSEIKEYLECEGEVNLHGKLQVDIPDIEYTREELEKYIMEQGISLVSAFNIRDAIKILTKALREDPDYFYTWQANIAMAFKDEIYMNPAHFADEFDFHTISNTAAKNFLNLLCNQVNG